MDRVSKIIETHFRNDHGSLEIGGVSIHELVQKYGTPLYVYDLGVLENRWTTLRSTFPEEISISYSVKANPNPAILEYFLKVGCGLEVASVGEYQRSRAAGCSPENIIFAGPGKTVEELKYVLENGIGEIHIESTLEIERLRSLCAELNTTARIAIRVNPDGEALGGAMQMGGRPAPFGIDEETLEPIVESLKDDPFLDLSGLHLFTGTQILDSEILLRQYRKALSIAKKLARQLGRPLESIDFGGGLGIPYFKQESPLDLQALNVGLVQMMDDARRDPLFAGSRFMIEPGRFLVGECGIYVSRVNDIKRSRGQTYLILDGGMHHHLAASGNLGQVIRRNYPVALLNKLGGQVEQPVDVVGPLCTPLDILARQVELPRAEVGDIFGIFNSGAYARSASPLEFLSHRHPPEILVDRGRDTLISVVN